RGLEGQGARGRKGEADAKLSPEGYNRARVVVVLGPPQEERAPSFYVAKVDVVAEGDAGDRARAVDHEDQLGLRIAPYGGGMHADAGTQPHRGHGRALGEELGVGADAHLEVLGPHLTPEEDVLDARGLGRAGT